jgi:succinate dehydrogenase / fumarate reductase cytochrome b subunit
MTSPVVKTRPKNLNLFTIRLPLPGIVSIFHRLSGALLFLLGIPLLLAMLQGSLANAESFAHWGALLTTPFAKLILFALLWSFLHHFCAGIRFLLLDIHVGIKIDAARKSSMAVMVVSLFLTLIAGVMLW